MPQTRVDFDKYHYYNSVSGVYATYDIYNLETIARIKHLDLAVDYTKFVTQLYKSLKMHELSEYSSYGIPGLQCCIQILDAFDDNNFL